MKSKQMTFCLEYSAEMLTTELGSIHVRTKEIFFFSSSLVYAAHLFDFYIFVSTTTISQTFRLNGNLQLGSCIMCVNFVFKSVNNIIRRYYEYFFPLSFRIS